MTIYFDNVLIDPIQEETSDMLFIPDTMREKPNKGLVVDVGNGKPKEPMMVKKGDIVLYKNGNTIDISLEGKSLFLIKQSDILLKIEG